MRRKRFIRYVRGVHTCRKCREGKPLEAFPNSNSSYGKKHTCLDCTEKYRRADINYHMKRRNTQRSLVLNYYSNNSPACACCGEVREQFLGIDHTKNDGAAHRKELKGASGSALYNWLIKNNYPEGFQVLCHNCNLSKGFYGECPHIKEFLGLDYA